MTDISELDSIIEEAEEQLTVLTTWRESREQALLKAKEVVQQSISDGVSISELSLCSLP